MLLRIQFKQNVYFYACGRKKEEKFSFLREVSSFLYIRETKCVEAMAGKLILRYFKKFLQWFLRDLFPYNCFRYLIIETGFNSSPSGRLEPDRR